MEYKNLQSMCVLQFDNKNIYIMQYSAKCIILQQTSIKLILYINLFVTLV